MKKQTLSLITILGLLTVIIILIFRTDKLPVTNVYCNSNQPFPPDPLCNRVSIPISIESANDVMLYYKVDDNCNFQTLLFDATYQLDSLDYYPYTNLGRFTGEMLSDGRYQINKLELKSFHLKDSPRRFKISNFMVAEKSTEDHIFFNIEMSSVVGNEDPDDVDYTYGENSGENPIIINKDALIDFEVTSFDGKQLPFVPGGGYECNGKATTGGNG